MDHLLEAKGLAHTAFAIGDVVESAQLKAQLATAHALIALVGRMDKAINLLAELAETRKHKIEQEENRDYNEYR